MRNAPLAILVAALALPALAKPAPKKPAAKKPQEITAKKDRIKQMHDFDIKFDLGLPIWSHGGASSEVKTKWTEPFRVSPPLLDWVTDYGEAEGSAYRVRLSHIKWPDGQVKSLYDEAHTKELFKNLVGHLYKLTGKELEKVLGSPEGQQLFTDFSTKIDDGGFDFPMKIVLKG
jgi:hypothetical protein